MQASRTLAAIVALGSASAAWAQPSEPLNLLFYGNSFTASGGGVHLLLRDIATAAGHATPHVFGRVVSGQTLSYHLSTGTSVITSGIAPGESWDAVILQEYSTRPTSHPSDGNVPAFLDAAEGLYEAVLDHSPGAAAVLFQTWARAPGHSFYPGIWDGPATMQAELRANYELAADRLGGLGPTEIAPVGDAFEAGGFSTSLYASDLYHASNKGALLVALVQYGTIYDDPTVGDIDLTALAGRLGLSDLQVDEVVGYAEMVLIPGPGSAGVLAVAAVAAGRRRRR